MVLREAYIWRSDGFYGVTPFVRGVSTRFPKASGGGSHDECPDLIPGDMHTSTGFAFQERIFKALSNAIALICFLYAEPSENMPRSIE
jgi:hypothetical protein